MTKEEMLIVFGQRLIDERKQLEEMNALSDDDCYICDCINRAEQRLIGIVLFMADSNMLTAMESLKLTGKIHDEISMVAL